MYTPANSNRGTAFGTLAGSCGADLQGEEIVGHWEQSPGFFYGLRSGRTLIEEFVNWGIDAKSILRFTRRFGPLANPRTGNGTFRESLQQWRSHQMDMRRSWEFWARFSGLPRTWTIVVDKGEYWTESGGDLIFVTPQLDNFLQYELHSLPADRFRICARPDCQTRFFQARHLRQSYCSEICAQWGQQQWKRRWWAAKGDAWRKHRQMKKSKNKGANSVARKAR